MCPKFGFDANSDSKNYGSPMANHACGIDIHPYNLSILPIIVC